MKKFGWLGALVLALGFVAPVPRAMAQALPVSVDVSGNVASARIGLLGREPMAELTLAFRDVTGLNASSVGISARIVDIGSPALLSRLPDASLLRLDGALPLLVTIEPPAQGGLRFRDTGRIEIHTHLLPYTVGSNYRLFKAPLGGMFRDVTDEIAQGSVRARGTYGGFSEWLVLLDLRPTGAVVQEKLGWLRQRVDALPATEQPAFAALLDDAEAAVARADYAAAIASVDAFRARAEQRAGTALPNEWRATRDVVNHAGELVAGAATLRFSVAYLRDFGQ